MTVMKETLTLDDLKDGVWADRDGDLLGLWEDEDSHVKVRRVYTDDLHTIESDDPRWQAVALKAYGPYRKFSYPLATES